MKFLANMAAMTSGSMFLESEMLLDPKRSEDAWFIEGKYAAMRRRGGPPARSAR
jgi:hypothetical protein